MSEFHRVRPLVPALIACLAGFAVTFALVDTVLQWEDGQAKASFEARAGLRADALESAFNRAVDDLQTINTLFVARGGEVTREEFRVFTASLLARAPFVTGFAFHRMVTAAERPAFEQMRQREFPGYRILAMSQGQAVAAPYRPVHRVIDYIEPIERNREAFALDADSISPLLAPVVERAALSAAPQASSLFRLVMDQGPDLGLVVLSPLYRGSPRTPGERREALYGFTASILRTADMVEKLPVVSSGGQIDRIELFARSGSTWIQAHRSLGTATQARYAWPALKGPGSRFESRFTVAGQEWRLQIESPPRDLLEARLGSILTGLVGLLATLALTAYLYSVISRTRRTESLVEQRTLELNQANSLLMSDIGAREAQNHILSIIAHGAGLPTILDEIIQFADSRLPGAHCMIVLCQGSKAGAISACLPEEGVRVAISAWINARMEDILLPAMGDATSELVLPDLDSTLLDDDARHLLQSGVGGLGVWPIVAKGGDLLGLFLVLLPLPGETVASVRPVVRIASDLAGIVIESRRAEDQIRHLAHHDELTGLPNRLMYTEHLQRAVLQAKRTGLPLAVLFVDLDRFKNINDSFGHDAGDEVLRILSIGFRSCLRSPDTIARIGGDEFIILVQDYGDTRYLSDIAERLLQEATKPFKVAGQECHLSASIGVALYPDDGQDAGTLVKNADVAMYRAKTIGRNNYQFYSAEMNVHTVSRIALESSLRRALERHEIVVHYQPKVDVRTGQVVGAEALVRWQQEGQPLLLPASFVPFAEEIGLISTLGMQVLEIACGDIADFQRRGVDCGRIAINLSGLQFNDPTLVDQVSDLVSRAGISASRLEFEITESMVMHHREHAVELMESIRALGVMLSIDDFGTGYSSLASLKRFPVNSVKVDKSFIEDVPGDSNSVAIVHAIIAMAHSLGLKVTAEGVETPMQLDVLRRYGCDEYQGFYFSPALPAHEYMELVGRVPVQGLPA